MNNPSDTKSQFMPFPKAKANLALDRKRERANLLQQGGAKILPDVSNVPKELQVKPNPVVTSVSQVDEATIKNPSLLSLDLPSNFLFYQFKELRVELIKGLHQAKFARAAETKNLQTLVEAVSSTIGTPGVTAFDLTVPDFYWLLYWHKLNSFTKAKFIVTTECENPKHIQRVVDGQVSRDSLVIQTGINRSSVVETRLESMPELEDPVEMPPGIKIKPAVMRDVVEYMDHPLQENPEFQLLGQFATMIEAEDGTPLSITDRVGIVEAMSADQIQMIRDYETATSQYGIDETMEVKCKECGASKIARLSIDAFSFLPS